MVKWIVVAVIVLGLAGLLAAVGSLVGRLRRLDAAARRAQRAQAEPVKRLEAGMAELTGRTETLQVRLEGLQHRER